jgi:hypothetical protein
VEALQLTEEQRYNIKEMGSLVQTEAHSMVKDYSLVAETHSTCVMTVKKFIEFTQ